MKRTKYTWKAFLKDLSFWIGDYIMVNKQIPGPRVYSHFPKVRIDGKVVTKRFRGIRAIRRNDILVFNFPYHAGWDKIDKAILSG